MAVAVYLRYSSSAQDAGFSCELQEEKCRAFIAQHKDLCREPIVVFADRAESGMTFEGRASWAALEERARRREFKAIVAYKYDRVSRDFAEAEKRIRRLAFLKVPVISATEGENKTVRRILSVLGTESVELLGERTHDGLMQNARQGYWSGSPPYGYRCKRVPDPSGKTDRDGQPAKRTVLEIDPAQAAVVRRIFTLYTRGRLGMRSIAAELNEEGIKSARGGTVDMGSIRSVLRNPIYTGRRVFGKCRKRRDPDTGRRIIEELPVNQWVVQESVPELRIIPARLWAESEALFRARARADKDKDGHAEMQLRGSRYLLSGLIHCGECEGGYFVAESRNNGARNGAERYYYLSCSHFKRRGGAVCSNRRGFPMAAVEDVILGALAEEVFAPSSVGEFLSLTEEALAELGRTSADLEAGLRREMAECDRQIKHLVDVLANGDEGMGPVKERLIAMQAQRAEVQCRLDAATVGRKPGEQKRRLEAAKRKFADWRGVVERIRNRTAPVSEGFRRQLAGLIEDARLYRDGRLEVKWAGGQVLSLAGVCTELVPGAGIEPA